MLKLNIKRIDKIKYLNFKTAILGLFLFIFSFYLFPIYFSFASYVPSTGFWQANDAVFATTIGPDGLVYIGGYFDYLVGPDVLGGGITLNKNTGNPNMDSKALISGGSSPTIYATASDGSGGWYIGGQFTSVKGVTRNRLAHIYSDGTLDLTWNPNANNTVRKIIVDSGVVYIAGEFTQVNGATTRNHLAALNTTDGTATSWDPDVSTVSCCNSSSKWSMQVFNSKMYVVGRFNKVNQATTNTDRQCIAAFDLTNGTVTSWDPNITCGGVTLNTFAIANNTMYVGGTFNEVYINQTTSYNSKNILGIDLTTAAPVTTDFGVISSSTSQSSGVQDMLLGSDGKLYVGGIFNRIQNYAGNGAVVTNTEGLADTSKMALTNGTIRASVPDGSGGWYIGGDFTSVRSTTRNRVAHLNSDGTLDNTWNPNITNGTVYTMALGTSTLYVGGTFTTVNGATTRNKMAGFNLTDGTVTAFNPNVSGFSVYTSVISTSTIYAAGLFSTVNGATSRTSLAQFDLNSGTATSWNPTVTGALGLVNSMASSTNGTIYVGGSFTTANGTARVDAAAFSAYNTGSLASWNPSTSGGEIYAVLVTPTSVFLSGSVTNGLGEFDLTTGATTSWTVPQALGGTVRALAASSDTLYAGLYGSCCNNRPYGVIAYTLSTPAARTSWYPQPYKIAQGQFSGTEVYTISLQGSTVFLGGTFSHIDTKNQKNAAAFDLSTAQVTSWAPEPDSTVNVLASDGSSIFAGTSAVYVNTLTTPKPRLSIAAFNMTDGTATSWSPNVGVAEEGDGFDSSISSISINGNDMFLGGSFTRFAVFRNHLASIDPTTGKPTTWRPYIPYTGNSNVYSIAVSNDTAYVGGQFVTAGNFSDGSYVSRKNAAAFSLSDSSLTSWDPSVSHYVSSVALSGSKVYLGGHFTTVNQSGTPVTRNYGAAFDLTNGLVDASWNPNTNSDINVLLPVGSVMYAGGYFSTVNQGTTPLTRNNLASFNLTDGTADSWNPDLDSGVNALVATGTTLYVGGDFSVVNQSGTPLTRNSLAGFDMGTGVATNFNPDLNNSVLALSLKDNVIYAGGYFSSVNVGTTPVTRNYAASFNLSDSIVTSWNPNFDSYVYSMGSLLSRLFIGGDFTTSATTNLVNYFGAFSNNPPDAPTTLGTSNYVDGSTIVTQQPQFTFNLSDPDVSDQVKYRIVLSKNSDFSSPTVDYTSVLAAQGSASFTVGQSAGSGSYTTGSSGQNLSNGNYYWKVQALDGDGTPSSYTLANNGAVAFVENGATSCNQPIRYNVTSAGVQANDISGGFKSSTSADGRYIAYSSKANNLVPSDLNTVEDVFVYDKVTSVTQRISVTTAGVEGDGASDYPQMSADGRYVVFESTSTNLVPGDTNNHSDVFIRDLQSNTTTLVSNAFGGGFADGDALSPFISPDGNKVAFSSLATNMIASDTNSVQDIFIKDLTSGITTRVSVSTGGTEVTGYSSNPVLSYDGRYVVFASVDDNIAPGDNNSGVGHPGNRDTFWHDTQTGETRRVSVSTAGVGANQGAYDPAISWDGMIVAFESNATNLVAGDVNSEWDVYVRDMNNLTTEKVDLNDRGAPMTTFGYSYYDNYMSYDGRYITFEAGDADAVTGFTATSYEILVRDRVASTTRIASMTSDCLPDGGWGSGISADGQYVHFISWGTNLVTPDTNGIDDNFLVKVLDALPVTISSLGPSNKVDGSSSTDSSPTLSFNFSFPAKYQIQIDDTSDFSSPVVDYTSEWGLWNAISFVVGQSVGNGTYTVGSASQTLSDGSYYWRVRATDNNSVSTAYSTANSGSVAFVVGTPAPSASPSSSTVVTANGPPVGMYGQVRAPHISPYIAALQEANTPLPNTTPIPIPIQTRPLITAENLDTSTQNVVMAPKKQTNTESKVTATVNDSTEQTPVDLNSLPPCPAVLGASATKVDSKAQSSKTSSGSASSNSTKVGNNGQSKTGVEGNGNLNPNANAKNKKDDVVEISNTIALPLDTFDYTINNGTTVKEINSVFVAAIKHARDFRKLTLSSVDKKAVKYSDVVKYANDQFKIAREKARKARNIARGKIKNSSVVIPTPTPTSTSTNPVPVQSTTTTTGTNSNTSNQGTTTTSSNQSTGTVTNTTNSGQSNSSTTVGSSGSQSGTVDGTGSTQTVPVSTGTVSTGPDGKPCLVYKNVVLPEIADDDKVNTEETEQVETVVDEEDNSQELGDKEVTLSEIETLTDYLDNLLVSYYLETSADTQDFVASIPDKVKSAGVQTTGAVAVAMPLLASVFLSTKSFAGGVPFVGFGSYVLYFVPQALKMKKKAKPWGTVYDSVTKRPIPFARVEILNSESRKLESAVTDAEGRYGFLVAPQFSVGQQALVQLKVYQKNYNFPSLEIPTENEKILYENIYQGGLVDIQDKTVDFDIPMDPKDISKVLSGMPYFGMTSVTLNNLWTRLSDILFALGIVFALLNYAVHPNWIGLLPIILILVTSLLRVSGFKLKSFGLTKESTTKNNLPFTFIALHNTLGEREKFTVSDERGRYFILSTKGKHILRAYTAAHISPMRQVAVSVDAKHGWISNEIDL